MTGSFTEFDLIARIRRQQRGADPRVPLGIGDDAALLAGSPDGSWLVAADMLLEGRHFETTTASPRLVGRKALAVNLSDIAAMGGRPVAAFVTVAHRREQGVAFAGELHAGIAELASEFDTVIAGGDTNVWDGPLVVSVTLLGDLPEGRTAVRRSGAQVGDSLFVTGPLGGSLRSGRHLTFPPRVREAQALHDAVALHAMIDVSDGLLADLGHICEESGVGARLLADAVPVSDSAQAVNDERTPLDHALSDGEDFELVFCVNEADAERLRTDPPAGLTLFEIGEIVAGSDVVLVDATGKPLPVIDRGWKHRWEPEQRG